MITAQEAVKNSHSTWTSFDCPVHRASHPTARINTVSLRWVCMSCGAKGRMNEIQVDEDLALNYIRGLLTVEDQMDLCEAELDMYDVAGPGKYWLSRFTPEACKEFRLGHDGETPIYPIRDETGYLRGIVRRNPHDERPKYRYPRGVATSRYLFGYEKITSDDFMLVEGAPDVVAAWEAGFQAVGSYGSHLSERQKALICRVEPRLVVVAYDSDGAGYAGAQEAVLGLMQAGVMATSLSLENYHDIADIPLETRSNEIFRLLDKKDTVGYLLSRG